MEKIFLAVSLVFVTYVIAAFLAGPNWGDVAQATVIPQIPADTHFVSLVIAMIGTTIAPWMMFFTQSNVVDKEMCIRDRNYGEVHLFGKYRRIVFHGRVVRCISPDGTYDERNFLRCV